MRADEPQTADIPRRVLAALRDTPRRLGETRLVAIDGPTGSGKTTLAATLHEQLTQLGVRVETLHMDDLYDGWTGLDAALEDRVLAQVLHPLATGDPARWQQYDWYAGRFDRWHRLTPPEVLILEGCGSGARAYAAYTSLLVWLEADRATRLARGLARDGEQVREHWLRWMELESGYFASNGTAQRADISWRSA